MGVSKVVYSGETLVDLTSDTVTAETLAEGVTAHNASGELIVGNDINSGFPNVPSYHYEEAGRVVKNILEFKAAHPNNFIFGAVSDIHVYANNDTYEANTKKSIRHAAFALETVGAAVGCDFIVNLGDNCWENGIDTDNAYTGAKYAVNALKPAFDRLTKYSLVGNHDKSDDTQKQFSLIGAVNAFDHYGTTQIRGFGYKDFEGKKIRVIALNTCDYLNASGGCALSYEQKDFLMRALDLSAKSDCADWQIVLLSHIPLDWNGGDYNFYADLQEILTSYESGISARVEVKTSYALNENPATYGTYSNGYLVYSYGGKNAAKIIANVHGHVHTNKVSKIANTGIVRIATVNANPSLNKAESYPDYGDYSISAEEAAKIVKVAGTAKDTAATFYCIDLDEQTIYAFGYGADIDRAVSYKGATMYSVSYNLTKVTSSNTAAAAVEGGTYTATLIPADGATITSVVVTMGGVDITATAYASGVISVAEVTGDIVITAAAEVQTSYTNVIDEVGTVDNVRLRSGGNTASASAFASNYFPVKSGDIIRVQFPNGNRESIPSNGMYCCVYSDNAGTLADAWDAVNTNVLQNKTATGYEVHLPTGKNYAYARVAGAPAGAHTDWIVTVNEPIE